MAKIVKEGGVSKLVAELGDNGTYTLKGVDKVTNTYSEQTIEINIAPGALEIVYEIPEAGEYPLFYEKVSPAGNEDTISVFPEGTIGKLTKEGSNEVVNVELYHETTSKADGCFKYNFTEAGTYTLSVENWVGNTNDPGTQDPADAGKSVYAQMFRGSKISTIKEIKGFSFPSTTASFYSMFNSCTATGHFPSVMCTCVTRPTDMFDSAHFESIGNIIFPNAWKTGATDTNCADSMFLSCTNLKSVGNVILPYTRGAQDMFAVCGNLERIGVLDCLKNVTNSNVTPDWKGAKKGCEGMFRGCTKLASIKFASLPLEAGVVVDLTPCPLNADSLDYMAANVNDGAATINFSATSKALANYATVKAALEAKGYTVDPTAE